MRAPLAQLHSLGKIRHPAAAAVDADDVDVVVEDVRFPQGAATAGQPQRFRISGSSVARTFASVAIDM
jgi:hypothetical protein